jgi:hypothetical protein
MHRIVKEMFRLFIFLIPEIAFAQLGAKIPADISEGGFNSRGDFWIVLFSAIIWFVAPFFIAKKNEANSSVEGLAISYWKYWFYFFAGFLLLIIFPEIGYLSLLIVHICMAFYFLTTPLNTKSYEPLKNLEVISAPPRNIQRSSSACIVEETKKSTPTQFLKIDPYSKKWAVLGSRIYDKKEHGIHKYELQKSKNTVVAFDEARQVSFKILTTEIDVIKFKNGIAHVACPRCETTNLIAIENWVTMHCSKCRFTWIQHLFVYND